ncbi:NYN domain-containing protein [Marinicauda pacifica]|uniref:NYN domain-containing protein n=1 Tax=Marinicauda pacifica TaxID=1133559 RepID=UPI0035C838BC
MTNSSQQFKPYKIRVFVDFWNFTLSLRRAQNGFMLDWTKVASVFTREASNIIAPGVPYAFEAMHIYGSFDPAKPDDAKFRNWFSNWLDKQPGVHTVLLERQRKRNYIKCPACQAEAQTCQTCRADLRGTEEKGIDTRIVTDMISLAWSQGYDSAVLVSSDRDFVPVAEFLQAKGTKVVHAAFPPNGSQLSQRCWGNFSVNSVMEEIERT